MPVLKKWRKNNGFFGIWKVTENVDILRRKLKADFPYDQELTELRTESRKLEYLATRLMLKSLCKEEKQVGHYASGKPYLLDGSYKISISHTKGYVAVGVHATRDLGVDIEYRSDRVRKVADYFLHKEELKLVGLDKSSWMSDAEKVEKMLLFWSAKEAFFKILDQPGISFREDLILFPADDDVLGAMFRKGDIIQQLGQIYFSANDEFVCTWVVADNYKLETADFNKSLPPCVSGE